MNVAGSWLLVAGLLAGACRAQAPATRHQQPATFRVCADPNNLPYSSSAQTGFENKIATLIANDWNARVQYTWLPQRFGFARLTLKHGDCDVILGVPSNYEQAATTRPYYRSTYVFVTRRDRRLGITSFDDPQLHRLKVGVQLPSPAAQALSTRGIIDNITGFPILDPHRNIVSAVANGDVDIAIVWGPQAAWFAKQQRVPLDLTPVSPQIDLPFVPFVFDISMGVRRGDNALKDRLEQELDRRHDDIDRILDQYGVPRV
jgi:quinoprotein dehydrogenase-associated probable ABC transporter substrate-binding protein